MKKITMLAAAAVLTLSACATATSPAYNKNDALGAISAAEHEASRAGKVGFEWRDTGKLIKKAKKAMQKEDYNSAVKLANKAKRQGTLALGQYESQKNAGPRY